MSEQPEALWLADAIEAAVEIGRYSVGGAADCAAAELRRLHEANEAFGKRQEWWNERMFELEKQRDELLEALKMAIDAHGKMLMSDPPQEAWKAWRVEEKARAAIAKVEGEQ